MSREDAMRILLTLLVSIILLLSGRPSFAGTDLLSNALTQSNSFLKQAGLVQKKYSGIARKILTTKVSLSLDNINLGRLEKYKEKAEVAREKAARVEDYLETAKERKEELVEKYNRLNAKALEYKAMADAAIAEGNEIRDMYRSYKSEVEDIIDTGKEVADTVKEAIGEDENEIKRAEPAGGDTAVAEPAETEADAVGTEESEAIGADEAEAQVAIGAETSIVSRAAAMQKVNNESKATFMPAQRVERINTVTRMNEATAASSQAAAAVADDVSAISTVRPIIGNKAEAITSAAVLAQDTTRTEQIAVPTQFKSIEQGASLVSLTDVMKAAAENKATPKKAVEAKSQVSIQQQLSRNSGAKSGAANGQITSEGLVLTPSVKAKKIPENNIVGPAQRLEKANVR